VNFAVNRFEPYILGLRVIVETDHAALVPMFMKPKECASPRVNKWAMSVTSKFDLEIVYKPGKSNTVADAMSRAFPQLNSANIVAVGLTEDSQPTQQLPGWTGFELSPLVNLHISSNTSQARNCQSHRKTSSTFSEVSTTSPSSKAASTMLTLKILLFT